MRKDNHRHERAKNLISGHGASCKEGYARGGATKDKSPPPESGDDGEPDMDPKKRGGKVSKAKGAMPKKRLDKPKRYATGGGIEDDAPKSKKGSKTTVNVIISSPPKNGPDSPPMPMPVPMGAPPGGAMPPHPMPPAGIPPAGMPSTGGVMPPKPSGAFKRGGKIKDTEFNAGAGGGKGRLEKAAAYKKSDKPGKNW